MHAQHYDPLWRVRDLCLRVIDTKAGKYGKCSKDDLDQCIRSYRTHLLVAQRRDPLAKSIMQGRKSIRKEKDSDILTEYRLLPAQTPDDMLSDFLSKQWRSVSLHEDCTGKPFTVSMTVRRTPAGIVFIHKMEIDQ